MITILRKESGIVEDNIIPIPSIYLLKTPHPKDHFSASRLARLYTFTIE